VEPGALSLVVPDDAEGARLDRFLAERIPDPSRSVLARWIREGRVRVDGRPAGKTGLSLRPGMRVVVEVPPPPRGGPRPESIPLDVVHEDDDLLVLIKPAGMVVHAGAGRPTGTLINALLGRGTPLAAAGGTERPGIVHRLDRGTSGLMVVAKTDATHRALAEMFARREIEKSYLALVWGRPDPPEGCVERAIGRSRNNPTKMTIGVARGRRRAAVSFYRTVESLPGFALLAVRPRTGRTHQIRVHLQSIHHAVVGDEHYGGQPWHGVQDPLKRRALRQFDRLALHAAELAFTHPVGGRELRFRAPLGPDLAGLIEVLRSRP